MSMSGEDEILYQEDIRTPAKLFRLEITKRDLGEQYPGLVLYVLRIFSGGDLIARFGTNTFEYPPSAHSTALAVVQTRAAEWGRDLRSDPVQFEAWHGTRMSRATDQHLEPEVLILQGSPRPAGNCSTMAGWARAASIRAGRTASVVYVDDLTLHACTGCYQCYNEGACVFEDDMAGIVRSLSAARLVIVCTPVYTNTVPGSLKIVMDRCQALHAEQTLTGWTPGKRGLLLSVAGRKGLEHFTCITRVVDAFLGTIHIRPSGSVLFDDLDARGEVRAIHGAEQRVQAEVERIIGVLWPAS